VSFLETLVAALPGSFLEVMGRLLALLSQARDKFPEVAAQIDWLIGELTGEVSDALTADALKAAVVELVDLFVNFRFGPPNSGAGAIT